MHELSRTTSIPDLTDRMQRLKGERDIERSHAVADELLVQALMVIASRMPSNPRNEIARLLDAYDRVGKHYA